MMERFYVGYKVCRSKIIGILIEIMETSEIFKRKYHRIPSTVLEMKGERGKE